MSNPGGRPATDSRVDVAIVGAGPVGLFSALELLSHGLDVVLLEKRAAMDSRLRARVFHSQTVSLLDRRDLLGAIDPSEQRRVVHYGGIEKIDLSLIRADHPYALFARQQSLETALSDRLDELGQRPRRQHTVTGLREEDDVMVEVSSDDPAVGDYTIRARTVLACDGGGSTVRKLLGIPFEGTEPTMVAFQGLMALHSTDVLPPGWHRTDEGMYVIGPGRRMAVIDFGGDPARRARSGYSSDDLEEEFAETLDRVLDGHTTATEVESLTRFTDNSRVARSYRAGRVFLVGDAAHVHPPFAGQGLNLGLQDAANLVWKLSAVLQGHAPASLLDTYEAERRPIAERVVNLSLSQSALMRPDEQTTAMRWVMDRLLDDACSNRVIGELIGGITTRYSAWGDCGCAGTYARDEALINGRGRTTLTRLQREHPTAHVVIHGNELAPPVPASHPFSGVPAVEVTADSTAASAHARSAVRLVRPDGYVAACARRPDDIVDLLRTLATRGPHFSPADAIEDNRARV